jgi:hypothetical protein
MGLLGIDDGYRKLPTNMPAKNAFSILSEGQKTDIGKGYTKILATTASVILKTLAYSLTEVSIPNFSEKI